VANPRRPTLDSIPPDAARAIESPETPGSFALSASFEDFYEVEHRDLFGAMCLVTGNRHDAEELTQEAFLRVWERWDLVQGLQNPTGYLYRTAMNAFRMRYRRAKTAARRVMHTVWRSDELDAFETRDELDRGLRQLTPRQRAAVILVDLLGLSYDEAGRTLHVKAVTVRKLVSQGRLSLRTAIVGEDD
jgi:RNA polymerase sigma-70 factor, ECF subfamily